MNFTAQVAYANLFDIVFLLQIYHHILGLCIYSSFTVLSENVPEIDHG